MRSWLHLAVSAVDFSRGLPGPSCGARRMAESAALLVDDVLLGYPIRQWVLSLPIPLRLLLARYPRELSKVMQIIHRAISTRTKQALPTNKLRRGR